MKHLSILSGLALLAITACGSNAPSPALVDARRAVDQARQSDAQRVAPDRVLSAQQALDAAERAHAEDAGSLDERSLAYVALRKAELAEAYGSLLQNEQRQQQAQQSYVSTQDRLRREAENRADYTQRSLERTENALAQTRGAVDQERAARMEAEKRAGAALQSLREIAQVKEEARGNVILLEGSLLFATAKSELLPVARQKLDQVADALKQVDSDQRILVEGYTDSRGADDANQRLSEQRAESVRSYLVSRGVKADMISSVGRGEQQPIADNNTAEGRASNRRVEIIVQPKGAGQPSSTQQSNSQNAPGSQSGTGTPATQNTQGTTR
ncbi:MAG TPA: OmpA family protein [Polyangiaceae bacterium]|nr:OmpA family protein [Polyangiaceae bacterium]